MIRVMIADDHSIVREGLKQIIKDVPDMCVSIEAASGDETLKYIRDDQWDVLLLDIGMPGKNVLELINLVKLEKPSRPVLVLSMYSEDQYGVRMLRAGADGYLKKECAPESLVAAIRKLAEGGKYISNALAVLLVNELNEKNTTAAHSTLTDREFQVFMAIAQGKNLTSIATEMSLSIKTISTYRTRLLKKMNLTSNGEIILYAIEHELKCITPNLI
jgi:DNA-binding NarL/FixJ family response regulator